MTKPTCSTPTCERDVHANGLCPTCNSRAYRIAHGTQYTPTPCTLCGEPMPRTRGATLPMHRACKDKVPLWKREGRPSPRVSAARRTIARAAEGSSGGKRVWTAGACPWCGQMFTAAGAKWCSTSCKAAAKRKERKPLSFNPTPSQRLEVLTRDEWKCQLCSLAIDPSLHYLDSWAATLDHIIPQSATIVPDHSTINLRAAHRWCNSARGDGHQVPEGELLARAAKLIECSVP